MVEGQSGRAVKGNFGRFLFDEVTIDTEQSWVIRFEVLDKTNPVVIVVILE